MRLQFPHFNILSPGTFVRRSVSIHQFTFYTSWIRQACIIRKYRLNIVHSSLAILMRNNNKTNRICSSSDSEVQIVTQIKETQQNQPMFTIDGFPNWHLKQTPESVELGLQVTHMVNLKSITTFVYITEKCKSMTTYPNSFENEMVIKSSFYSLF